jgi:arylsulfatase A-like enzyme
MYDPDQIELPPSFDVREPLVEEHWSRKIVRDLGEAATREFLRIYYAQCRLVDDQIGRVLDALDATGRADETLVLFASDHGDMAGGHGMVWKSSANFYEEVVRVPMVMRWPGRIGAGRTDMPYNHVDLAPTLLSIAGRDVPETMEGTNLAPYLLGRRDPAEAPRYAFCERVHYPPQSDSGDPTQMHGSFAIRGEGWKYARYGGGETEWLFDLANDPHEMRNLAADPTAADRKRDLADRLNGWLDRSGYAGQR